MTEGSPLLRLLCGECGRPTADVYDEPRGRIRVVFTHRRPIEEDAREFKVYRTPAPAQSDPASLESWTSHSITLHCYQHRNRWSTPVDTKDLVPYLTQARRTAKTVYLRCASDTIEPA